MESSSEPKAQTNGTAGVPDGQNQGNGQILNQQAPESLPPSQGNVPGQTDGVHMGPGISADEIALYDRQIRLWGVKAQEKIRTANVLLIGLKGLGNEVAKNLVLAGINSLTIVDDNVVTEEDLGAQFLIRTEHVGMIRSQAALAQIQKLNPRVTVGIMTLDSLFQETSFFGTFTIIIATDMSLQDNSMINAACRMMQRPFYASGTYGMYGYIFTDLINHEFVISRDKSNVPTKVGRESSTRKIVSSTSSKGSDGKVTELVTKRETYTPILLANASPLPDFHLSNRRRKANVTPVLSCLRALWEYQTQTSKPYPSKTRDDLALFTKLATAKHHELQLPSETLKSEVLRSFLQSVGSEISPTCAFLGGQLAQDVINVIGGKEQPIQNILVFDGEETKAPVYALHTELTIPVGNPMPMMPAMDMPIDLNGMGMPMMGVPLDASILPADPSLMPAVDPTAMPFQAIPPGGGMLDPSMANLPPNANIQNANVQSADSGTDPKDAVLPS